MKSGEFKIIGIGLFVFCCFFISASGQSSSDLIKEYPFDDQTSFIQLANRYNLGNWKVQGAAVWTVEDGAFVGKSDASSTKDTWLFSANEWDDIAIEIEFYVVKKAVTAIGLRMPKDSSAAGYQKGIELQLTDGVIAVQSGNLLPGRKKDYGKMYQSNQWNQLAVVVVGDQLTVYVNRKKIITEKVSGAKKGRLGMKISNPSSAPGSIVRFRNLKLRDLKPVRSFIPSGYKGKPFVDKHRTNGAQVIPGRVECALFDFGGEGVAYHDFETENRGSGGLNMSTNHQRPHATPYEWTFRKEEHVDLSYAKDFADFNHNNNYYIPAINQFYVGWTEDNEWLNYTVDVKVAGTYSIDALYANKDSTIRFAIDQATTGTYRLPLHTGNFHYWNKGNIGTITFEEAGLHLLTFYYNKGNNFAWFEFTLKEKKQEAIK
jgi:Domain of Unknown Function (DUF1080)/DUF5010 C-terminal domain